MDIKFRYYLKYSHRDNLFSREISIKQLEFGKLSLPVGCRVCARVQYTGRNDSRGVEIYERDIVAVTIGDKVYHRPVEPLAFGENNWFLTDGFDESDWTVIGNVYQNPELMSDKIEEQTMQRIEEVDGFRIIDGYHPIFDFIKGYTQNQHDLPIYGWISQHIDAVEEYNKLENTNFIFGIFQHHYFRFAIKDGEQNDKKSK